MVNIIPNSINYDHHLQFYTPRDCRMVNGITEISEIQYFPRKLQIEIATSIITNVLVATRLSLAQFY